MMENFEVQPIPREQTFWWLKNKHYAKRIPGVMFAFGLYDNKTLVGVCTFGMPCRAYNNGEFVFLNDYRVLTLELNRLVINDGLPKNTASYFVSRCLNLLPKPCCVVSYADDSVGHHGYIYQALNFIYTGLNEIHDQEYIVHGKKVHARTLTGRGITATKEWAENSEGVTITESNKKHRYFIFVGNRRDKAIMQKNFRFERMPYPKGDNARYDSSNKIETQGLLF